jgi:hypothetical protein
VSRKRGLYIQQGSDSEGHIFRGDGIGLYESADEFVGCDLLMEQVRLNMHVIEFGGCLVLQ